MSQLMREAGTTVELGWLLGVLTAVFFASFLFWVWYAYAPSRKSIMDEASRMPFDGDES
jgi:cbb3-type cytochrome oxidase subunit 3